MCRKNKFVKTFGATLMSYRYPVVHRADTVTSCAWRTDAVPWHQVAPTNLQHWVPCGTHTMCPRTERPPLLSRLHNTLWTLNSSNIYIYIYIYIWYWHNFKKDKNTYILKSCILEFGYHKYQEILLAMFYYLPSTYIRSLIVQFQRISDKYVRHSRSPDTVMGSKYRHIIKFSDSVYWHKQNVLSAPTHRHKKPSFSLFCSNLTSQRCYR